MTLNLRRWALAGPCILGLLTAPACVTVPALTVDHAEFRGASTGGLLLTIVLRIRNDNSFDVQVRNVHALVTIGRGYALAPVDFAPNQWLRSGQTTFLSVPVAVPWNIVPSLVGDTSGGSNISYHIQGSADVTASQAFGINRNGYPVDEEGTIPRQFFVDSARRMLPFPLPF